jgi:predicted XRE-type DNA-binding protein
MNNTATKPELDASEFDSEFDPELQAMLAQLTDDERNGAILSIDLPADTLIQSYTASETANTLQTIITAKAIGAALAQARKQAGLRAKDIATSLGISPAQVTQIENQDNNFDIKTIVEHAQASGYDVELVLRPKKTGANSISAQLTSNFTAQQLQKP